MMFQNKPEQNHQFTKKASTHQVQADPGWVERSQKEGQKTRQSREQTGGRTGELRRAEGWTGGAKKFREDDPEVTQQVE